jgi:hypothetical protein
MDVMTSDDSLKKPLPFSYDQDLSKVLTHLNRRTPFSPGRLAARPPVTALPSPARCSVSCHCGQCCRQESQRTCRVISVIARRTAKLVHVRTDISQVAAIWIKGFVAVSRRGEFLAGEEPFHLGHGKASVT